MSESISNLLTEVICTLKFIVDRGSFWCVSVFKLLKMVVFNMITLFTTGAMVIALVFVMVIIVGCSYIMILFNNLICGITLIELLLVVISFIKNFIVGLKSKNLNMIHLKYCWYVFLCSFAYSSFLFFFCNLHSLLFCLYSQFLCSLLHSFFCGNSVELHKLYWLHGSFPTNYTLRPKTNQTPFCFS